MGDEVPTPSLHDGMAVIRQLKNWLVLVRNHGTANGFAVW